MAVKIQLRGDTKANWLLTNPVISEREMVLEADTGKYKIGDGVKKYADLSYHGIDGKPSRITADGFWEIYNPATDAYTKTEYKAVPSEVQVSVKTNNATTYILTFVYAGGTFDTPNLRGTNGTNGVGATVAVVTNTTTEYVLKFTSASGEVTTPNLKPQNYDDTAVRQMIANVEAIARGRSRAQVFDTVAALDSWLAVPANVATLQVGDNFYIKALDVPDYWWDGSEKQPIETEKVDLSDYYKITESDNRYATKDLASQTNNGLLSKDLFSRLKSNFVKRIRVTSFESDRDPDIVSILVDESNPVDGSGVVTSCDLPPATTSYAGVMTASDKMALDNAVVPTNVTVATTLTGLSIANYSIKVTLSGASALSFASTPPEGWECMIDIKNTSSADITQALPNASGWQCEDVSMTIGAGKIASISVRYVHSTYVVIAKGN